jgi:hypothetical protein
MFCSQYSCFPLSVSFHRCSVLIFILKATRNRLSIKRDGIPVIGVHQKKCTASDSLVLQMKAPNYPSKCRGLHAQRHGVITMKTRSHQRYFHCSLCFRLRLKPHDRHFCQRYNGALSRQLPSRRCIFCVPRRQPRNTLSGNNNTHGPFKPELLYYIV